MKSSEEIKEMVLMALEMNLLDSCLEGRYPHKIECHQFANVSAPTDTGRLLREGIYKVHIDHPEMQVNLKFHEALHKMLDGRVFSVHTALLTIFTQLQFESQGNAPFRLDAAILKHLRTSLLSNQQALTDSKEWDDVLRINNIIEEQTDKSVSFLR